MDQPETNGDGHLMEPKELWSPSIPESTQVYQFKNRIIQRHGLSLQNYDDLREWSIRSPALFWEEIWHYTGVKAHKSYDTVSICSLRTCRMRANYSVYILFFLRLRGHS